MDADRWLTLADHILVDIFRCLDATTLIRCAGVCRPWRCAIIDNASCLRRRRPPLPDPNLLLGFLDKHWHLTSHLHVRLQYVPASSNTPAMPVSLFTPAMTGVGVFIDSRMYNNLLSSRDGILLLGDDSESLCLCTAMTGACKVLPAAEIFDRYSATNTMYVLATGHDIDDFSASDNDDNKTAVWWILAVKWLQNSKEGIVYQIFSSMSGAWGPTKTSAKKFPEDVAIVLSSEKSARGAIVVVCHGIVSWFIHLFPYRDAPDRRTRKCVFSMDLRTEHTWTTELPEFSTVENEKSLVLAVSEDGRLTLVSMLSFSHQMKVWELVDDGRQWTLRRTIDDVKKVLPNCKSMVRMELSGFCPRSGYLFGSGSNVNQGLEQDFVIGVDGSSPRLIGGVESSRGDIRFPYEIDWSMYISSYISNMKYF